MNGDTQTDAAQKRFRFVDHSGDQGEWKGPFTQAEMIELIKAGRIQIDTPVWDDVRVSGRDPRQYPAWQALGISRQPSLSKDPWKWKPAVD